MRRTPLLYVISFVGISVLTAVLFQLWQSAKSAGTQEVSGSLSSTAGFIEQFEPLETCAEPQKPLALQMESFPPVFRAGRKRVSSDFPRACISFAMTTQHPERDLTHSYARCGQGEGSMQKLSQRPCLTQNYVNVVYNLFGDVTSCLEVPQKDLIPRLLHESGFHFSTLGPDQKFGVGQMGPATLARAERSWPEVSQLIANSEGESCRTLRPHVQRFPKPTLQQDEGPRCSWVNPPQSPLRQFLYLAIRYQQDSRVLERYLSRYDINGLMRRTGLSSYEPEQLHQLLMALSHRAGPATAVLLLKNYLEYRSQPGEVLASKVTQSDFGWSTRQPASGKGALTFAEYLNESGSPELAQDLVGLWKAAQSLNQVFKEGTCVPESYLSLSF